LQETARLRGRGGFQDDFTVVVLEAPPNQMVLQQTGGA
jgi:hypothetical protein